MNSSNKMKIKVFEKLKFRRIHRWTERKKKWRKCEEKKGKTVPAEKIEGDQPSGGCASEGAEGWSGKGRVVVARRGQRHIDSSGKRERERESLQNGRRRRPYTHIHTHCTATSSVCILLTCDLSLTSNFEFSLVLFVIASQFFSNTMPRSRLCYFYLWL